MNLYFKASLSLCFLTFCLFGARTIDRTLVTVNDEIILESDVDTFMQKMKSKSFQELFGGKDMNAMKDKDAALQLLVDERIINQQVKKLELTASDQEVEGQIKAICKRNGITKGQLEERLKQLGTPFSEYKDGIKKQIERKTLIDREIKPTTEVTEDQIRHYFMQSGKGEGQQTEYKIAHILFAKKASGPAPLERAKTVRAEIEKKPESFAKFAKESSDDSSSAEAEGVLGFFTPGSLSKEFRAVVTKLEPGQISAPVKTSAGVHLLKVLETRASDSNSLPKEQREQIRAQILQEEMEKKMVLWLERKKAEANVKRFHGGKE